VAADRVSTEIAQILDGGVAAKHPKRTPGKHLPMIMAA